MENKTQDKYASMIFDYINENEVAGWKAIMHLIETDGFTPNSKQNWLFIRGAVQMLINEGSIERTKDVHNENYRAL